MIGSVLDAIGNTPVVKLRKLVPPGSADVIVKLEYFNPTGSYKDRMALAMIEEAEKRGDLRPGMRVVEYTGGSTGSSLAMVCADVTLLESENGKITPGLFDRFKKEIARRAAEPGTFYTDQLNNADIIKGYQKIGDELVRQLGSGIAAFCGAVGSAGMLIGVSRGLRAGGCRARIVALEPAESPVITKGTPGPHRVEGIGVGFPPPLLTRDDYDEARAIPEASARAMARRLAREEGILAGTSTGLNVTAALELARELGSGAVVATVATDTGLKYLAGDLYTG